MESRFLDFAALGVLIFVALTFVYLIIFIHDIPYEIAKRRNHPHQDAIHTAGWVSLFLMHTIWPFLWIWATLYKPDRGWGMMPDPEKTPTEASPEKIEELTKRIEQLEKQIQGSKEA